MDRLEKSKILVICLKNTYGGLSSKMLLLSSKNVYAKLIGKIGKVLDICISTICNSLKQNKLRIIALPFLFQAIVIFSFVRHLCGFSRLLK